MLTLIASTVRWPTRSLLYSPTNLRLFSVCCVNRLSDDPGTRQPKQDEAPKKSRYLTDPESREKKEAQKRYYAKRREQPKEARKQYYAQYYAKHREQLNEASRRYYAKHREQQRKQSRVYYAQNQERLRDAQRSRYKTDADHRMRRKEASADRFRAQYNSDPEWRRILKERASRHIKTEYAKGPLKKSILFRNWVVNNDWVREELEWKTHSPVLFPERTKHYCSGCEANKSLKLWWKRKSEQDQYDCYKCFISDWSRVLPIGYEGFVFGQGKLPKRPGQT